MSYRQTVPKAQPRTLRSRAEKVGTVPAGFDGSIPYVPNVGLPAEARGAMEIYDNPVGGAAQPIPNARPTTLDPKPFGTLKRGG